MNIISTYTQLKTENCRELVRSKVSSFKKENIHSGSDNIFFCERAIFGFSPTNAIFSGITFIDNVPCLQILWGICKSGGIEQIPI